MIISRIIRIYGIVQGVGFRPTVKRLADEYGITGTVRNAGAYVEIRATGEDETLIAFISSLRSRSPERSEILKLSVSRADAEETGSFKIVESLSTPGEAYISPDIAICDECAGELFDKNNSRYLHPFINCTLCGPRFSILERLPYDRERTSMKSFSMCPSCAEEYRAPASRRFDAQPVCCNRCGPRIYGFLPSEHRFAEGLLPTSFGPDGAVLNDSDAISSAREVIRQGGIVAVKGIGGFHLCCDAFNDGAVRRLRERKHRPMKPFALLFKDIETVERFCIANPAEKAELTGHRKPIVLLERREEENGLSPAVAPDNPRLGVMLPYVPIHLLLFRYDKETDRSKDFPEALVITSGNVSGAPIAKDDEGALSMLGGIADLFLSNDRPILTRSDDSVVIFFKNALTFVRRSRGYAPLPLILEDSVGEGSVSGSSGAEGHRRYEITGDILAVGGELKNTFCIGRGNLLYPSAYIGDMADERSVAALGEAVERMIALLEADIKTVVCDLHPGYNTTRFAERFAEKKGAQLLKVQHHYAHILSCMAEHDLCERVLGLAFDGTGYGTDGTVWGGEILEADLSGFTRRAYLAPFNQPGGDAGIKDIRQQALSFIFRSFPKEAESTAIASALGLCGKEESDLWRKRLAGGINTVISTSAGRLFDAASAILGLKKEATFEGEAAMALQAAAEKGEEHERSLPQGETLKGSPDPEGTGVNPVIDTDALIRYIVQGRLSGEAPEKLAFDFHAILADRVARKTSELGRESGILTAVLSGGCFQNLLFLRLLRSRLEDAGFRVFSPLKLPANDGGLAPGQCFYAIEKKRPE